MNKTEQFYQHNKEFHGFIKDYFDHLYEMLCKLDMSPIEAFAMEMEKARKGHNTIFIIGNGGSAGTASHMANDFGSSVMKKGKKELLFRALALTDSTPVMLGIGNDNGYDNIFVYQLRTHYRPGDKLVAISASGNSPNVIAAAEWVKEREGVVMSLVGFDGGKLKDLSDIVIHVKSEKGEYGPVEDIHMIINHLLANWFHYRIFDERNQENE